MVSSCSPPIPNLFFILSATAFRSGGYPSVMLYWRAAVALFLYMSAVRAARSSAGKDSGEGFPAAKLIIVGSERA